MRTWRVGTFSMGASLLFLGVILLFSQVFHMDMSQVMIAWWPAILIILGIEILVYLFLSKDEKPFLKYDFLSIFFVAVIGTIGIGVSIMNSTGLLEKVNQWVNHEEKTMDLPVYSQPLADDIKRVVLDTGNYPISIEGIIEKEISMFGTYRMTFGNEEKVISSPEDYILAQKKGDTLYLSVKELPRQWGGNMAQYEDLSPTILVPHNVELEVQGNYNIIQLKPRTYMSHWTINNAEQLSVQLENTSNVKVTLNDVQTLDGKQDEWNIVEETFDENKDEMHESPRIKQATFQLGDGSQHLQILNSYSVEIKTID